MNDESAGYPITPIIAWHSPPAHIASTIGKSNVDVWQASTLQSSEVLAKLHATLSIDEQQRAARFRFDKHRRASIVSRGMLRDLLSRYLAIEPQRIELAYNAHGKPALAAGDKTKCGWLSDCGLRFNVSHSGDRVVCAIAVGREVGIDVEAHRPLTRLMAMAQRFFSPDEHDALSDLPPERRQAAFFRCWSRKEAYIKAIGRGLHMPLDRFSVSLEERPAAALLTQLDDATELLRWSLFTPPLELNYGGALFVELKPGKFSVEPTPRYYHWSLRQ